MSAIREIESVKKYIAECEKYMDVIKSSCNESKWGFDFNKNGFINQCFDDIQNSVMREFFGDDYYTEYCDGIDEQKDLSAVYDEMSSIRTDFIMEAKDYIANKFDEVRPDLWDNNEN